MTDEGPMIRNRAASPEEVVSMDSALFRGRLRERGLSPPSSLDPRPSTLTAASRRSGRAAAVVIVAAVAAVAATVLAVYLLRREQASEQVLRLSGNIEVIDAQVSFKIPGRVKARLVDEGEQVQAGQVVALLEDADLAAEVSLREAEVAAAQAALAELLAGSRPEEIAQAQAAEASAKARLDELKAGSRPQEIAAAQAAVDQAKAELERRKIDYDRLTRLKAENRAADIEYERARTDYEAGKAMLAQADEKFKLVREGPRAEDIRAAEGDLAAAAARRQLVVAGPRVETIDRARAGLDQAKAALLLARTRRGYATLHSPLTGVVLSRNIEPGEIVAAGTPVVTVADLRNAWLRVYVPETDLGRVKLAQKVRVTADTWPGREYVGRVSFISAQAEFTPKPVQTPAERVKLVYRVKIDVDNPSQDLKPGMPADAEIRLDQSAPPPASQGK